MFLNQHVPNRLSLLSDDWRQQLSIIVHQILSYSNKENLDLWHCRMEHNNKKVVLKLSKSVEGMKLIDSNVPDCFCDICAEIKMHHKPSNSKGLLENVLSWNWIFSMFVVQLETTSLGCQRYVVSFIDSYSRFARAYLMKNKWQVLDKF